MEPQEMEYNESLAAPSPTKTATTAMSLHDEDGGIATAPSSSTNNKESIGTRMKDYLVANDGGREFLACLLVASLFFGCGYLVEEPQERPIPYQFLNNDETGTYILNLSLNNKFDGDTVPDWAVYLLVAIVPCLQILLSCLVGAPGDMHRTVCVYLLALAINDFSTWMLKAYAGYFRPSFYQLCQPDEAYEYCTNSEAGYARDSFPSGHASFCFLSTTVLALYLERCFGVSSIERVFVVMTPSASLTNSATVQQQPVGLIYNQTPVLYRFASMLCYGVPLAVAAFIGVSRVVDNRHHPADIIGGGILGSFLGYFFSSLWFQDRRFSLQYLDSAARERKDYSA